MLLDKIEIIDTEFIDNVYFIYTYINLILFLIKLFSKKFIFDKTFF